MLVYRNARHGVRAVSLDLLVVALTYIPLRRLVCTVYQMPFSSFRNTFLII